MDENKDDEITYDDKMYAHLIEADFCIREAVNALAEKGDTKAANAASLIAIADCLLSFGMIQYELLYNMALNRKEGGKRTGGTGAGRRRNVLVGVRGMSHTGGAGI